VVSEYKPPLDKRFASILVPTVDTTKYAWLLETVLRPIAPRASNLGANAEKQKSKPVMFCGFSGAAKTVTVKAAFDNMGAHSDGFTFLKINFSSRTSSFDF
jgi:hypothetical protein